MKGGLSFLIVKFCKTVVVSACCCVGIFKCFDSSLTFWRIICLRNITNYCFRTMAEFLQILFENGVAGNSRAKNQVRELWLSFTSEDSVAVLMSAELGLHVFIFDISQCLVFHELNV